MVLALALPGSLEMVLSDQQSLVDLSLNASLPYSVVEANRTSAQGDLSFVYYIETNYDINSKITYQPSSTDDNRDDAYGLTSFAVSSSDLNTTSVYNLPSTQEDVVVQAGEIDATDPSGEVLGKFTVNLLFGCSSTGILSATAQIVGDQVAANVVENPNLAQQAYWPDVQSAPVIDASSADILNTRITVDELTTLYNTELTNINNQYNNNQMIASWTINVDALPSSSDNALASRARLNGVAGLTSVFASGARMVVATPATYSVSISNYIGAPQEIVAEVTNVYGVLKQT